MVIVRETPRQEDIVFMLGSGDAILVIDIIYLSTIKLCRWKLDDYEKKVLK